MNDHYVTLGVSPQATPQEIESAYRRIALERGWEDGYWRELRDAYDVLSNPQERARYDAERNGASAARGDVRGSRNPTDRVFPNLPTVGASRWTGSSRSRVPLRSSWRSKRGS